MPANTMRRAVLVVEDDPDYCDLLLEAFEQAGFRTFQAGNGERALEILRDEAVDLVVSDFIMPELNGLELCRLLAENLGLSKAKVVLYSCNTDSTFRRKARELGALDYLEKSDDAGALVRRICELLEPGIEPPAPSPAGGHPELDERLRSVTHNVGQIRLLFDSLMDFVRILALSEEPSPTRRLAWEAAQRTSGDIKRILTEIEDPSQRQAGQATTC